MNRLFSSPSLYGFAIWVCILFAMIMLTRAEDIWVDGSLGPGADAPGCGPQASPCGTIGFTLTSLLGSGPHTINLVSGHTYRSSGNKDLLLSSKNITIQPTSTSLATVIDCEGSGRFLTIEPVNGTILEVKIQQLSFQNCAPATGPTSPVATVLPPRAHKKEYESLIQRLSKWWSGDVSSNKKDVLALDNGGVILANHNVSLILLDCTFENNHGTNGAVVYMSRTQLGTPVHLGLINITKCRFTGNVASNGAIYSTYSTVLISDTSFIDNLGNVTSGAIWWLGDRASTLDIKNSQFEKNHGGRFGGSALHATSSGYVKLHGTNFFDHNTIGEGPGTVYLEFGTQGTVSNCRFERNHASSGGALAIGSQITLTIKESQFIGNTASRGGAISIDSSSVVEAEELDFQSNQAAFGGAIYVLAAKLDVEDSKFILNHAHGDGGSVYGSSRAEIKLEESSFDSNSAVHNGSAIYCHHAYYTLKDLSFSNNTAGSAPPSNQQDFNCGITAEQDFCYIEGDSSWDKHCELVTSKYSSFPKWLIALIAVLAVILIAIIVVIALWIARVKRRSESEEMFNTTHQEPNSVLEVDDEEEAFSSAPVGSDGHLWDVVTKPNQVRASMDASLVGLSDEE